jgi:hypothetical protein
MAAPTEPEADPSPSPRPQVLYVMGAGRSGSTILGVALGNCDGVFYAGELDKWLLRAGEPPHDDDERASFWSAVRRRVSGAEPLFGSQAHQYLERSSALVRLRTPIVRRRIRAPYRRVADELYQAIGEASGARCIVDTSHYPLRAHELRSVRGIDLYLILLVRDPRDVVASFARDDVLEPRFRPATTRMYLLVTYLLSVLVFCRQRRDRRIVVLHEDFLADPRGVLQALLDQLGSRASLPDLEALQTGIPFQGNRLIREHVVALHGRTRDAADRSGGPLIDRLLLAALSRLRPRAAPAAAGPPRHSGGE